MTQVSKNLCAFFFFLASSECDDKSLMLKDTDLSTASPTVPAVVVTPPSQEQGKPEVYEI